MAQYALPISDLNHLNWSEGVGDGNGTHFEEIDEGFGAGRGSGAGPDDDTTYWQQDSTTSNWDIFSQLTVLTDPVSNVNHFARSRNRKSAAGGRQIDLTLRLYSVNTIIKFEKLINIDEVWATHTLTLTATEADNITDYADMKTKSFGREVGGGGPRKPYISAQEFECPDAPGGGGGFAHSQGVIVG